jgi:flavin reductase (DIM6/NTAB) family NADH-FMN oxidoreductase RutF
MIPPVPAVLLTVKGLSPGTDEISVVWTFVIEGKPPQIGISVANEHVAQAMIEKHGEFVLNVPVADMIENFDAVDMNSSQVGDKFELSGLTRGKAAVVDAPTVSEAPIHAECKVLQMVIAPPNRKVFIAEVAATTVLDNVCDDDGRLLVDHVDFFGMTSGSGEFYTMGRKVGHIGKSVRRTDIKY